MLKEHLIRDQVYHMNGTNIVPSKGSQEVSVQHTQGKWNLAYLELGDR